tara:strand:- start:5681 stop:6412 length:732 start_codon:yes stop_codon:yes gene_type:complete
MTNKLMVHCGGINANYNEVCSVPLPQETETYVPVPYKDIIDNTKEVADTLLKGYEYDSSQYALSGKDKDGNYNKFFGVHYYKGDNEEMHQAIGMRSSYDKSMANGVCAGARIFVCDNMAFVGEITIMRKHTKNVLQDLQDQLVNALYRANKSFTDIVEDTRIMKDTPINKDEAYEFIGKARGYKLLSANQSNEAYKNWDKPPFEEFEKSNMWSLYNACTEALKTSPPNKIIEKHIALHKRAMA